MTCGMARSPHSRAMHDVSLYATQYNFSVGSNSTRIKEFWDFQGSRQAMMGKGLLCCSLSQTTTPALWVSVLVVGKEAYARDAEDEQLTFLSRFVDISDSAMTTTSPRPGGDSFSNNILSRLHLFRLLFSEPRSYNHVHGVTTCATATQLCRVVWHVWRFLVRYNNRRRRRRVDQNDRSLLFLPLLIEKQRWNFEQQVS